MWPLSRHHLPQPDRCEARIGQRRLERHLLHSSSRLRLTKSTVTVPPNRRVSATPRYRNPADWRTRDDRPICFYCGRIGHISCHCRAWSNSAPWPHPPPYRPPAWNSRSSRQTVANARQLLGHSIQPLPFAAIHLENCVILYGVKLFKKCFGFGDQYIFMTIHLMLLCSPHL